MTDIDEEDDYLYNEAYMSSHEALKLSTNHTNIVAEELRRDLLAYLDVINDKTDSEGNHLIKMPSNFNKIADAMTRADLISSDIDNQWSKTLLEQQFTADFEGGRYKNEFKHEDNKLQKGLAEIHVLDNLLKASSKRATEINRALSTTSEPANFDTKHHRSTPRSLKESIFITRPKSYGNNSEVGSQRDDLSSRGSNLGLIGLESEHDMEDDAMNTEEYTGNNDNHIFDTEVGNREEAASQPRPTSKMSSKMRSTLSEEDELRLQSILHDDYEKYIAFGSAENNENLLDIDAKLSSFGRYDRRQDDDLESELMKKYKINADVKSKEIVGATYLQQQRKEKVLKEHEQQVDKFLQSIQSKEVDLSSVLDVGGIKQPSSSSRNTSSRSNLLEVPSFEDVMSRAQHKITQQDIEQLVKECLDEHNSTSSQDRRSEDSSCGQSDAQQQVYLDRLLASIRIQCDELSKLRHRNPDIDSSLQETDNLLHQLTQHQQQIELAMEDIDDNSLSAAQGQIEPIQANNRNLPSSERFAKHEVDILRKLVERSESLRLPPVPGAEGSSSAKTHDVITAAGLSAKAYTPLDKAMSRLLQR